LPVVYDITEMDETITEKAETKQREELQGNVNSFLSVVSQEIGWDIIYVKSELHYVRVVTSKGERLVLFNLKDAIDDLEKKF